MWRLDGTARDHDFALHVDNVRFGLVYEVDTNSCITLKLYGSHDSFAKNMEIQSLCVWSELASSSIATLSFVGTCTDDSAKRVEDAEVITRPTELPH